MNFDGILNFVLIGAKSSGKTIYIATLWGEGFLTNTKKEDNEYLKNTWGYIEEHGEAEASSGMFKMLHFEYPHPKFGRLNFSIDDYDGTFTETISQGDDNTQVEREKLLDSVKKSEGIIFFLPYEDDPNRFQAFAHEIDAFIKLAQFDSHNKSPIPASIVVTKWDESTDFMKDDGSSLALSYIDSNRYLKRALKLIEDNFKNSTIIPISSFKKYNVLSPIDYSLENTFRQWYETAIEYKNSSEYEKLTKYLAKRHHDTKFNEEYEFKKLYNDAQIHYMDEIKIELDKKENYEVKEEYLNSVSKYFITQKNLLKPLYNGVKKEKTAAILKRAMYRTFSAIAIMVLLTGVILFLNKMNIDEKYKALVDRHSEKVSNDAFKKDLSNFLETYKNENFFYAFADIPSKRDEILKIKNSLDDQQSKMIDGGIKGAVANNNLLPDEKIAILDGLAPKADSSQQKEIKQETKRLEAEIKRDQWIGEAEDCLNTCELENGVERIESLLDEANNGDSIVIDNAVVKNRAALYAKKDHILQNITKKKRQEEFNSAKNKAFDELDNARSIEAVSEIVARMKDGIFGISSIKDKAVASLKSINNNDYTTAQGARLLNDIKTIQSRENFLKFINNDIEKFIDAKEKYRSLLRDIDSISRYEELDSIDYSAYSDFETFEKENVKNKLNQKIKKALDDIYGGKPYDIFNLTDMSNWLKNIQKINGFTIESIGYVYEIPVDTMSQISYTEEVYSTITRLKENGINNVTVTLVGKEDNSLEFECGVTLHMGRRDDISITGFSSDLNYDNASQCQNDSITYNTKITLKDRGYWIELKDSGIKDDKLTDTIIFDIKDLYSLYENKSVYKSLDKDKLQLIFNRISY